MRKCVWVGGKNLEQSSTLNILFLNAFSNSTIHREESSGPVYLQMVTAFYQLSSRLLPWIWRPDDNTRIIYKCRFHLI